MSTTLETYCLDSSKKDMFVDLAAKSILSGTIQHYTLLWEAHIMIFLRQSYESLVILAK